MRLTEINFITDSQTLLLFQSANSNSRLNNSSDLFFQSRIVSENMKLNYYVENLYS